MVQQRISRSSMDKRRKKNSWGIQIALELAELDYGAHGLRYESGISRGGRPPNGFGWVYSEGDDTDDCVLVLDLEPSA